MLKQFAYGMVAALAFASSGSAAETSQPVGVVELFTSQGCSSCPPADAVLDQLIGKKNVIAVAYHVDYWNYIGWADTLASKENTNRQYDYAKALMHSNVYTPQIIVNGRNDVDATDLGAVTGTITKYSQSGQGLSVPVSASIGDDMLSIKIGAGQGAADVVVAYFHRSTKVSIERGELAGKTMTYAHSVGNMQTVGMWDGGEKTIQLPLTVMEKGKFNGCAILLQTKTAGKEPGVILGAAQIFYDETN